MTVKISIESLDIRLVAVDEIAYGQNVTQSQIWYMDQGDPAHNIGIINHVNDYVMIVMILELHISYKATHYTINYEDWDTNKGERLETVIRWPNVVFWNIIHECHAKGSIFNMPRWYKIARHVATKHSKPLSS